MRSIPSFYGSSQATFYSLPGIIGRYGESHAFPQKVSPSWKDLDAYKQFSAAMAKDVQRGVLTEGGKELLDAMVSEDPSKGPKVTVYNFAVGRYQSKDMFLVQRTPIVAGNVNFVMYKRDPDFKSTYEFKSYREMDDFLKNLPNKPADFNEFVTHFGDDVEAAAVTQLIQDLASAPPGSTHKVLMGPGKQISGNVFEHLERMNKHATELPSVNGLTHLKVEAPLNGKATYSGVRPDGELVVYRYDVNGHLLGSGDKGNFYFHKTSVLRNEPLVPITLRQFRSLVFREHGDLIRVTAAIADFLEKPFSGSSALLQLLGVDKETADTVARSLDNPVYAVLFFLNKNNDIGRVFGLPKDEMNEYLHNFSTAAQSQVPIYGAVRGVAALIAKIIRQLPVTDEEIKEAASGLELKIDLK